MVCSLCSYVRRLQSERKQEYSHVHTSGIPQPSLAGPDPFLPVLRNPPARRIGACAIPERVWPRETTPSLVSFPAPQKVQKGGRKWAGDETTPSLVSRSPDHFSPPFLINDVIGRGEGSGQQPIPFLFCVSRNRRKRRKRDAYANQSAKRIIAAARSL